MLQALVQNTTCSLWLAGNASEQQLLLYLYKLISMLLLTGFDMK